MVPPPTETKTLRTLYSLCDSNKIGAQAPNLEKLLARRNGQLRSIIRTAVCYISSSAPVDKNGFSKCSKKYDSFVSQDENYFLWNYCIYS